jgi:hypothetical protein
VEGGARSFVPRPQGRLTAEVARPPFSPSARAGVRSLGVKLDLLAGRENARGVVGGSEAMSVVAGNVQLNVAAGSLAEDTAIALWSYDDYSPFIPTTNGITPLGEVTVDFASSTLNTSAALTFRNVAAAPGDTLVVARVDRAAYDGIPRLQVVALADVISANDETNAVTRVDTGLPGLTLEGLKKEGRYTLLRLAGPIGWITGTTLASGSPVRALVTTESLPFVATSNTSGVYAIPAVPGPVTLTARVLGQSLIGAAQTTAVEGAPTTVNILLEGAVSQATITPASGAIGVEVNDLLTLTSPVALDPATVNATNITLRTLPTPPATGSTAVALRFVLSGSGKQLSIIPQGEASALPTGTVTTPPTPALAFSTDYALEITGLLDTVGGLVTAPTTTFRTKDDIKPVYDLTALTFSFPDAAGLVTVSAPNGTLPPGTEILIINGGNGVVLGLTAGNDGQVGGTLPATLDDVFFVTVTDPFGNSTTFERGEFVDPLTGETAVGAFGGTVRGPAGSALVIPEQALDKGTRFKLDFLSPVALEERFPGQQPMFGLDDAGQPIGHVGGALEIEMTGQPASRQEIDLVFPIPANLPEGVDPRDAFYYVYQRVEGPCANGAPTCAPHEREYFLRTVDHAFVACENGSATCEPAALRVKTASPPFNGFYGGLALGLMFVSPVGASTLILMWSLDQLQVGQPKIAAITGYVYQPVRERVDGVDKPVFRPVANARVSGHRVVGEGQAPRPFTSGSDAEAVTGEDGRFTLFDPTYSGGPFTLTARHPDPDPATGQPLETSATGFESDPDDSGLARLVPGPLRQYRKRAVLNLSFPAIDPPPPPPEIGITVCERHRLRMPASK